MQPPRPTDVAKFSRSVGMDSKVAHRCQCFQIGTVQNHSTIMTCKAFGPTILGAKTGTPRRIAMLTSDSSG